MPSIEKNTVFLIDTSKLYSHFLNIIIFSRCFDLTDEAFEGLGKGKLCSQLSALHLDGCYKISDRTVLEVLFQNFSQQ